MSKKIQVNIGDTFNNWKVIEANVINPNTTAKNYIGKPIFSKCICTKCNETIRYFKNNELSKASQQCKKCTLIERNTENRAIQIGQVYGHLKVIEDAGYKQVGDKRRHYSLCECLLCGNKKEIRDNSLLTGNTVSCGCIASKGEQEIKNLLNQNQILYDYDCLYPDLLKETGRRLRFDFIIYNEDGSINRFVEFDGNQHKTGMWGGSWSNLESFEVINERDKIKNEFCLKHNLILIRVPYSCLGKITIQDIMENKYQIKED